MSYTYTLEVKLAKASNSINLTDYSNHINDSIVDYNNASINSTNKKKLEILEINNSTLLLRLVSEFELKTVGKALRYFSQLIIKKVPQLCDNITTSGQLFRVNQIGIPITTGNDPSIQLKVREIDDSTLIKGLIDYICKKRDPNTSAYLKKQKALEQMKQLAIEAGIITTR